MVNTTQPERQWPFVSVIICTKNRRSDLVKAIASVRHVDYPADKLELVIVEEAEAPLPIENTRYIHIPQKNTPDFGLPRNIGARNAHGEILVFTDDDCIVEQWWLKTLVSCFEDDVAAVAGGVLVKNCNSIGYCETVLGFPGGGLLKITKAAGKIIPTNQLSTCNCAFQRWVFDKVGYFRENTPYSGEDFDLTKRICKKYRCLYTPHAIVYHKARQNFWKIFRWFNRRGISEIFLVWMKTNPLSEYLWYNSTRSILLRFLILVMVLSSLKMNHPLVYGGLFLFYYAALLLRYRFQLQRVGKTSSFLLTPFVKLVMDLGMDAGRAMGPFVLLFYLRSLRTKKNET